jgi:assimilatory nitrate reductase catalytic subunit
MGGREVGGLANQLAAHMGFSDADVERVGRFWRAPNMARREGRKAVDMFEAIGRGEIKALWVLGTNPAVSLPRADAMRAAMGRLELFVVSDNVASNDTIGSGAHIVLPAAGWGEKDGTVTNSERRISRQRPFLPLPGEAKPDWWAVCQVAKRLGFEGFDFDDAAAIFAEHAALSAFENEGTRDFDIGGLAGLSSEAYDALLPSQWPRPTGGTPQARLFAAGNFFTPTRRAAFQAIATPRTAQPAQAAFPLLLNTGRVRDQWHTMTRTGLSQRLAGHVAEPFLAINPADAIAAGVEDGGLALVSSPDGAATLRVSVTSGQHRGAVFAPIHWTDETASAARVGSLVHAVVDPYSGQPDAKATPVTVQAVGRRRMGFVLARRRTRLPGTSYWAWQAIPGGYAATVETDAEAEEIVAALRLQAPRATRVTLDDEARALHRTALLDENRLAAVAFLQTPPAQLRWAGLLAAWQQDRLEPSARRLVLSGRTHAGAADEGPNVCACFGVPKARIEACIAAGARDPAAVGAALRAGTNCGSCVPEIKRLIGLAAAPVAAVEAL